MSDIIWHPCQNSACVQTGHDPAGNVWIRSTNDISKAAMFTSVEWDAFTESIRAAERERIRQLVSVKDLRLAASHTHRAGNPAVASSLDKLADLLGGTGSQEATPTLADALRASLETAKARRTGSQEACCDLHGRNCEPPSELCCADCTEHDHPQHRGGWASWPGRAMRSACSNPDLSPNVLGGTSSQPKRRVVGVTNDERMYPSDTGSQESEADRRIRIPHAFRPLAGHNNICSACGVAEIVHDKVVGKETRR